MAVLRYRSLRGWRRSSAWSRVTQRRIGRPDGPYRALLLAMLSANSAGFVEPVAPFSVRST
jgi:hypothetical protein